MELKRKLLIMIMINLTLNKIELNELSIKVKAISTIGLTKDLMKKLAF